MKTYAKKKGGVWVWVYLRWRSDGLWVDLLLVALPLHGDNVPLQAMSQNAFHVSHLCCFCREVCGVVCGGYVKGKATNQHLSCRQ